jgi:hypothetical protein
MSSKNSESLQYKYLNSKFCGLDGFVSGLTNTSYQPAPGTSSHKRTWECSNNPESRDCLSAKDFSIDGPKIRRTTYPLPVSDVPCGPFYDNKSLCKIHKFSGVRCSLLPAYMLHPCCKCNTHATDTFDDTYPLVIKKNAGKDMGDLDV